MTINTNDKKREMEVGIKLYCLELEFDYISYIKQNSTGNSNPYHNMQHVFTVALNCFDGAEYYGLSYIEERELFIAALFHDFSHSGGKLKDNENIAIANAGIKQLFQDEEFIKTDKAKFSSSSLNHIQHIISVTQYPFIKEPENIQQSIIRDSDLMQYLEPDADIFMDGLGKELGISITKETTYDFIRKQKIYTDWGQYKLSSILNSPRKKIAHI